MCIRDSNDALEQPDVVELSHGFESLIAPIPARLWLRAPHAEMYGGLFLFEKTQQLLEDDILHRDFLHCFKTGDVTFRSYALKSDAVSYTHLRAHETVLDLVCRLLLEKKKKTNTLDDANLS